MTFFWGELKRRNVFRVGVAYLAAVWVLIEVTDTLVSIIDGPTWIPPLLVYSSAIGFPIALLLAWFYELTPAGVKSAADVETPQPARFMDRKIDFAIIGLLVLAVGFLLVDDFVLQAPWFSFTGMEVAFEPIDSGAVGLQFMLHQGPEPDDPSQAPNNSGEDAAISDSSEEVRESAQVVAGFYQPISIPEELEELFGRSSDWSEFHEDLEREPDNLSWSTFMEGQIAEYLDSLPSFVGHNLLLAECRTSSCEIQLMVPYNSPRSWQLDLITIDQQPWFEFDSWELNSGNASPDSLTLILRLDGDP